MAESGKRRQRAASLEPILLRIARDGLPRIQQSLAARCGGFGRFPGVPIPYNFRTAPEASRSSKLSYWFCWRSLGDSNPCFRRERATSWAARRREQSGEGLQIAPITATRKQVAVVPSPHLTTHLVRRTAHGGL